MARMSNSDDRPLPLHPTLGAYYENDSKRQSFVNELFDRGSRHYDWVDHVLSFGSGKWYRGEVLRRAGLTTGMKLLDVATGTGPVAATAREIVGESGRVVGVDPSRGMLNVAQKKVDAHFVQAVGDALAIKSDLFDVVSMGYALRHVSDLSGALREYRRVLKPGGEVVLMELSVPRSRVMARLLRWYMGSFVPWFVRKRTGSSDAERMMRYYWDTTATCIAPERILDAMRDAGFRNVRRELMFGTIAEYRGSK